MSFPSQSNQYDPSEVEEAILDLQRELADEQELAATLQDSTSEQKLAEAQAFLAQNSTVIKNQHALLLELNTKLRGLVAENKQRAATDAAYKALVESDEFSNAAVLLAEMKAMVKGLDSFLVEQGVRGRTPLVAPQPNPVDEPNEDNAAPASEKTPRSGKKSGKSKPAL